MTQLVSVVAVLGHPVLDARLARRFVAVTTSLLARQPYPSEIVLVDYAPDDEEPIDRLGLFELPPHGVKLRIIRVPCGHAAAAGVPGFRERVAQNVGIRRAAGKVIVAATLEAIATPALLDRLATGLGRSILVPQRHLVFTARFGRGGADLPDGMDPEALLDWCRQATGVIQSAPASTSLLDRPPPAPAALALSAEAVLSEMPPDSPLRGNSIWLAAEAELWHSLRGLPEWPLYDQLLDRPWLMLARHCGAAITSPPADAPVFQLYEIRPRVTERPWPITLAADGTRLLALETAWPLDFFQAQAELLLPALARQLQALPENVAVEINDAGWGGGAVVLPEAAA